MAVYDEEQEKTKDPNAKDDGLEQLYNSPSATDADLPEGHPSRSSNKKAVSPEELKQQEEKAYEPPPPPTLNEQYENLNYNPDIDDPAWNYSYDDWQRFWDLYSPQLKRELTLYGAKKAWSNLSIKQKLIVLSIAPSILASIALIVFFFTVGPLKFIQAAQMLQKFHFAATGSFLNNRATKLYRYYKWHDKPQNRRVTLIGNRLANSFEANFKRAGMELEFDSDGLLRKIRVDRTKFNPQDLSNLQREFGVQGDRGGRYVDLELPEKFSGTQSRAFFDHTRTSLGLTGFGSHIQSRLVARRIGPSIFHPIKKLDESVLKKAGEAKAEWKKRKQSVLTGSEQIQIRGSPDEVDENGEPKPNVSDDAAGSLEEVGRVEPDLEGKPKVDAVKSNMRKALAVTGAVDMVTGLACFAYTMANAASDLEYQNVVVPSMQVGGYYMGLGSQVQSNRDLQAIQLGFEDEQMYDESNDNDPQTKPSSFFDAKSLQMESGKQPTGPDVPDSARLGGSTNVLSRIQESTPDMGQWLLNRGCGALNSPVGTVLTLGIDLVLAPASAVAGFAGSAGVSVVLDDVAKWVAGEEISSDLAGAALGGVANQGAFFMASQQFLTMGATPVDETERTELKSRIESEERYFAQNKSWTQRYFDLDDTDSLLSRLAVQNNLQASDIFSTLTNFPKILGSATGKVGEYAFAQPEANYDYGIPKFAYRPSELSTIENDKSYANPYANAAAIDSKIPEMHAKYGEKCFGLKFDDQEGFQLVALVDMKKLAESPDYADCRRTDAEFLRYRLYLADLMTLVTLDCYHGNETACREIGFGGTGAVDDSSTYNNNESNGLIYPPNPGKSDSSDLSQNTHYQMPEAQSGKYIFMKVVATAKGGIKKLTGFLYKVAVKWGPKHLSNLSKISDLNTNKRNVFGN